MAHCAVIRRFVSIWRRGLPLQRPDIPHHKHQNPSEGVEDAIDREFNDLFDQWRKLTNEILSEPTERYEIGESVLLGKAISYPAQVNSVIGVYYTALFENDEYSSIRPLIDWLHYNGFTTVTKPMKEYTDSMGRRKVKGNMHIELAVDAMEIAPRVDHIVLFSGDGDFVPLIASLQRQGVRVSIVSTQRSPTPMISDELRRQADNFIDLKVLQDVIGRPLREMPSEAHSTTRASDN